MYCIYCGCQLPSEALYCSQCGKKLFSSDLKESEYSLPEKDKVVDMAVHTKLSCELNNSKIKSRNTQSKSENLFSILDWCMLCVGIAIIVLILYSRYE